MKKTKILSEKHIINSELSCQFSHFVMKLLRCVFFGCCVALIMIFINTGGLNRLKREQSLTSLLESTTQTFQIKVKWKHWNTLCECVLLSAHDELQVKSLAFIQDKTFTFIYRLKRCKAWDGTMVLALYDKCGAKIRFSLVENTWLIQQTWNK